MLSFWIYLNLVVDTNNTFYWVLQPSTFKVDLMILLLSHDFKHDRPRNDPKAFTENFEIDLIVNSS